MLVRELMKPIYCAECGDAIGHACDYEPPVQEGEILYCHECSDQNEPPEDDFDDSMDGDHDSAMTSAGWGTDEDYGYFGGDE